MRRCHALPFLVVADGEDVAFTVGSYISRGTSTLTSGVECII